MEIVLKKYRKRYGDLEYDNEDGYHFDDYNDISSLYILRKKIETFIYDKNIYYIVET